MVRSQTWNDDAWDSDTWGDSDTWEDSDTGVDGDTWVHGDESAWEMQVGPQVSSFASDGRLASTGVSISAVGPAVVLLALGVGLLLLGRRPRGHHH